MGRLTIALVFAALAPSALAHDGRCFPLNGSLEVGFVTDGCDSPVGLCTAGKIRFDSLLHGATTRYTTRAAGPTVEDPTGDMVLSYHGRLVITARRGTIVVDDLGLFDKGTGHIVSQSRTVTGSGYFEGIQGELFTYGNATGTGFRSRIAGRLCLPAR